MLDLLQVEGADLLLTDTGKEFTTADIQHSKEIFAEQAREHAPLVRTIWRVLNSSADGSLRDGFFLDLLRRGFSTTDAQQQLDTAIDWGRYGELFHYDSGSGQITIDPSAASTVGGPQADVRERRGA
jgi:NitT/TauT family transport system ATP-binding protein